MLSSADCHEADRPPKRHDLGGGTQREYRCTNCNTCFIKVSDYTRHVELQLCVSVQLPGRGPSGVQALTGP